FPNPSSSVNQGLQKHFVNVGNGRLSFTRRDMVVNGRKPLVLARIYNSKLISGENFGNGWQLSLAETIEVQTDGTLLYLDDTATVHKFVPATVGYKINPAQNSDIKSVTYNSTGLLQITYLTGWTKQFQKLGNKHRLVSSTDNNKNSLSLVYRENQLSEVVGANGRQVSIKRNERGRIVGIADNNGRTVRYHYNERGLLGAVDDLGGNQWQYKYHGNDLLHKIIDPQGQVAGKFSYGKNNKATMVKLRARKFRYRYKGRKTLVTDENGDTSTFVQNAHGITTSVTDATGFISRIVLNDRNQITALWHKEPGHNDELQANIIYDDNGRPARYDINGKPTAMERDHQQHSYQYDDAGRLLSTGDTSFEYDARGNLTRHKTDKFVRTYQYATNGDVLSESMSMLGLAADITHYGYNVDGLLTSIKANGQTSTFEYNPVGKLTKVIFPDGVNHTYQYDKLGFRKHTKRSDKSAVDYVYDKVGNLKETKKYKAGATVSKNNRLTLNGNNQVTKIRTEGQTPMTIKYTVKGNPKTIVQGEHTTNYQYDQAGRLIGVDDSKKGQFNYTYQKGEEDIRLQLDNRTKGATSQQTQITGNNQTQAQLHYARVTGSPWQSIIWSETLDKLLVPMPNEINSPDAGYQSAKQRRRLRDAKSTIKRQQLDHDKPSNSQFTPNEYNIVNCDIVGDDGETGGVNQDCYLYGVLLDDPSTIKVGVPYTFSALAIGGYLCEPRYSFAIDGVVRGHTNSGYFTHTFTQSGEHTVQVNAECGRCIGYFKWDAMAAYVDVPPAPTSVAIATPTGSLGYIDEQVRMPTIELEATVSPSNVPLSTLTFYWVMRINHNQSGRTSQTVYLEKQITGTNKWTPNWGTIVAGGNNVEVSVAVANESGATFPAGSADFKILGKNPSSSQITTEAGSSPWFLTRLIGAESSKLQFTPSPGEPRNKGNGFGLMQVDNPVPSDRALWDWKKNIEEGKAILTTKRDDPARGSGPFWTEQVRQYNLFLATGGISSPPSDITHNGITFSYTPTGDQKPISDGLWIKAYNSAGTHWYNWNNTNSTNPNWSYSPTNALGINYVEHVCNQSP
ncbi:MAG: DUF6531 domain-containing protein, partial [Psychrosphaera sp.]|nr:DUF6531 domain-containing protein [Psychrosphaera sp.]